MAGRIGSSSGSLYRNEEDGVEIKQIYWYKLDVDQGKLKNIIAPSGKKHFEKPATLKVDKIYLIVDSKQIVYVGKTKQPIRNRLRIGENPASKTGYHGYKWLEKDGCYTLAIIIIENKYSSEAIEAEIVYNIRMHEDRWPLFQTEIHFHNVDAEHKKVAKDIYMFIMNKIRVG